MSDTNKIVGVVEQLNTSVGPLAGKTPKWSKVSFKIKGQWYGGFLDKGGNDQDDRAKVKEGDQVDMEFKVDGRYNNIVKVVVVSKATPSTGGTKGVNTEVVNAANSDYVPQSVRELRQSIGAGRKAAIQFVDLALKYDALPMSTVKNKKADALLAHVQHYTELFARDLLNAKVENFIGSTQEEVTDKEEEVEYSE